MGLRIGIVTEYYYPLLGGICENVHHTAVKLKQLGHDAKVITSNYHTARVTPEEVPDAGIEVLRVGRSIPLHANGSSAHVTIGRHLWAGVKAILARERFDLLHLHSPLVFTLPPLALLAAKCPTIGTFHSYFEGSWTYAIFHRLLQQQFLDRLVGVTAVSESCARALQRYFTMQPRIIPNGVDTAVFSSTALRLERFDRSKLTLLFLGRFELRNGLPFMLQAFEIIKARFPEVRLIVVGDGPARALYEHLVPAHLRADVHFEGPALRLRPSYYATADIFCSPVTKASFGMTLLEAMASGRPIVATTNVGYRELLSPDEATLVEPGSPSRFADAVVGLLKDERRRQEMSARGLRKAERYSWDRIVLQLLDYYHGVLQTCAS